MILNYLIVAILLIFLFVDYRKAVIFVAVFAINLGFFKFSILGSIWDFIAFVAIIIFIVQYDGLKILKHPLSWCLVLPFISVCLSMRDFTPRYILEVITQYIFPVVLFYAIKSEKHIHFYVNCMVVLLTMSVLYCFYEEITNSNPIMEWCYRHNESFAWMTSRIQDIRMRFGFKRSLSFFCGEAAFAAVCIYYWYILLMLRNNKELYIDSLVTTLLFVLPFCVLLTGTRSAIIAFTIISMSLLSWKSVKNNKILYLIFICAVVLLTPYLSQIYDAIFNSNQYAIGSSEDMREGQWEIAMFYMSKNLWFGNGLGFHTQLLESNISGIYGLEGMWLPIMINRGLFGVISVMAGYVIALIYLIVQKQYSLIWVVLSFLAFKTVTTVVGVEQTYYLLIVVFLLRYYDVREKTNKLQRLNLGSSPRIQG